MRQAGFTLMETIVALVVFAAVVVALERGTATGWRGLRLAQMDAGALALARARLASAGIDSELADESVQSGEEDRYEWRLAVRKYAPPEGVAVPQRLAGYWVNVAVSWRDRPAGPPRTIELQTLKLVAAPP